MNSSSHVSLIHVSLDLVGGVDKARDLLVKVQECGEIVAISSVYKRYLTPERVDLNARIEFVFRFETLWGVDQCLQLTKTLDPDHKMDLTLLCFDDMIVMSPRLTLPYPLMHQDPLIIRCAAEAWGQYEHPIYQKSLSEIARSAPDAKMAEFYSQGRSLVDF